MDRQADELRLTGIAEVEKAGMKSMIHYAGCFLLFVVPAQSLLAHGAPIFLTPNSTSLSVSGGLNDTLGYVSQLWVEDDEDGDGEISPGPVPGVGNAFLWEIPGINISGLNIESSLALEVLAPMVKDNPPERRTLWYWNSAQGVVPADADFYLLGTDLRNQPVLPEDTESLPPFLLVDPVGGTAAEGGQQGFHNHSLLTYALDFDTPPALGAYGIFVRFTSNLYQPSNPFLIVLNYGVDYEQMTQAALAMNAAAADALTGDFNFDSIVDAADYVVWRKGLPTDGNYLTWKTNFALTLDQDGGSPEHPANAAAPEPSTIWLLLTSPILFARRRGTTAPRNQRGG
jgi:hypothetical protein